MTKNPNKKQRKSSRTEKFPPTLNLKPVQSRTLRFVCTAAVDNIPIDRNCMIKLIFATDSNGNSGNTVYTAVRLKRVKIWAGTTSSTPASTSMVTAAVEWQSTRGPTTLKSDTGNSFEPAHVDTKPPKESEASFWSQVSSSTTIRNEILFYITAPVGAIVDVSICYVEANGSQLAAPQESLQINTVTPVTASSYLQNSLDNTANGAAGGNLIHGVGLHTALGV